jgi:hypothetical protein
MSEPEMEGALKKIRKNNIIIVWTSDRGRITNGTKTISKCLSNKLWLWYYILSMLSWVLEWSFFSDVERYFQK